MVKTLDFGTKHETKYCIPLWLRDEQIKLACALDIPRLQPCTDLSDDPIAVVCFGPSLQDTFEEIRSYKHVITCSGAHKFLLEQGIVPTWHVEVDPRPHKVALLGPPHKDVKYLIASTCHPDYFKHLEGFQRILWHVFSDDAEAHRILPRGEWALTGGSNVGLRAMTIARFFGFRQHHVFGMDGCQRDETHKHAAPHPLQDGSGYSLVEYKGVQYKTTPAMLESAKQTFHELDMMTDVTAKFFGEGLVQEMAKDYVRKDVPSKGILGFTRPELISSTYRELNAKLHKTRLEYGVGGAKYAPTVQKLVAGIKAASVLDYGCGKGYLARALPFPIWEYDPAIPGKDESPRPADLVVCLDVLEHIEPDRLMWVLDDLHRVTKKVGYFVIHTGPSTKTLEDGRNSHLIQEGEDWWRAKLSHYFTIGKVMKTGPLLHFVVAPADLQLKVLGSVAP